MFLLSAIFIPFVLSSTYWALEVAAQIVRIQTYFINRALRDSRNLTSYVTLFNAITLFNYVITDAVVVWRAWALCRVNYKKTLLAPVFFLLMTIMSISVTIGLRIASFFTPAEFHPIITGINICQASNLVCSLLTNVSATSIVSHKTWRHRRAIRENLRNITKRSTKAEKILALLVESGIIYCVSGATVLAMALIKLPFGTVSDIYTPVSFQLAGIYPTIVIVLVGMQCTMDKMTHVDSTQFALTTTRSQIRFSIYPSADATATLDDAVRTKMAV
ncbi:hypothetical protein EW026_g6290 [Hermanssonia centrifuga]|uniref:Uncharacterized protein n=1 Tax=Hermanssonia centrifuga TaxID=98765 RepID=A0A4S4KBI8_9APHY|nr:hypothetical protein EW026_g6290 [Hermanssonia centrifuga]